MCSHRSVALSWFTNTLGIWDAVVHEEPGPGAPCLCRPSYYVWCHCDALDSTEQGHPGAGDLGNQRGTVGSWEDTDAAALGKLLSFTPLHPWKDALSWALCICDPKASSVWLLKECFPGRPSRPQRSLLGGGGVTGSKALATLPQFPWKDSAPAGAEKWIRQADLTAQQRLLSSETLRSCLGLTGFSSWPSAQSPSEKGTSKLNQNRFPKSHTKIVLL